MGATDFLSVAPIFWQGEVHIACYNISLYSLRVSVSVFLFVFLSCYLCNPTFYWFVLASLACPVALVFFLFLENMLGHTKSLWNSLMCPCAICNQRWKLHDVLSRLYAVLIAKTTICWGALWSFRVNESYSKFPISISQILATKSHCVHPWSLTNVLSAFLSSIAYLCVCLLVML